MRFIRSSKSKHRGFIQIRGRGPNSKIAEEKVLALIARFEAGTSLWHPGDNQRALE